jgi:hypothetical protein
MTARGRPVLPFILALIPLLALVRMCVQLHVDVPFYDQWELVPRLEHLNAGTLTVRDVWMQHGEHRPMFPILLMLALARLSGWNIGIEILVNLVFGILIFLTFARYLATTWAGHGGSPWWLLPVASVLMFSRVQWENWLWGWQMTALMGCCAGISGLYLLCTAGERQGRFAGAIACGVLCLYSFGAGLVYWIVGPVVIVLAPSARRRPRLVAWIVAGGLTMATYFYDYHGTGQPSPLLNFASLEAIAGYAKYVLTFLGAPVAWYGQRTSEALGGAAVVAFAVLAIRLRNTRNEPVFLFPLAVGIQTIGIAALSGLGRASMGVGQAMSSRYTTFGMPLWCALGAMAVLAYRLEPHASRRQAVRALTTAALAGVMMLAWVSGREGTRIATGRSETLRFARRGLIVGRSDALMSMLYPNVAVVKERRVALRRLHLSVFRPSRANVYPVPDPL